MPTIRLRVNGRDYAPDVPTGIPLVHVLRNQLGLTGTKYGCGAEQCGACAVLVDGESVLSCVAPASEFAGKSVITVEGLACDGVLSPVQAAFVAEAAAQCGYCTPGLLVTVTALFAGSEQPDDTEIRTALARHLCRCGSHPNVVAAIERLKRDEPA